MLTVIETPMFLRYADGVIDEQERAALVNHLSVNPTDGDVIPGAAPLRKLRWSRPGMGKRGGVRIIYFTQLASGEVKLLIVYPKSHTENLSTAFLRELRKLFME
ncbi:MAG: transcriptional regulator [Comamonadaceae bacterium]|nr:transcriptional regulator [Comamonadaceae bacterium]